MNPLLTQITNRLQFTNGVTKSPSTKPTRTEEILGWVGVTFHSPEMFVDPQEVAETVFFLGGGSQALPRLPQWWHLTAAVKLQGQEIDFGTVRHQAWLRFHSFKSVSFCTHVLGDPGTSAACHRPMSLPERGTRAHARDPPHL